MTKIVLTQKTKKYGAFISPARDKNEPVYNWHTFKHSYSKELVRLLVKEFKLDPDSWVLDPFSGGGTTLLACKELGINAKGFDILPFSVFLSNVKTRSYNSKELQKALYTFNLSAKTKRKLGSLPDIGIANLAFSKSVRRELLKIRLKIESIKNRNVRDFFMLGLLSILEKVSKTEKAGGFLRLVDKRVDSKNVPKIFQSRIIHMIQDVEKFNAKQQFLDTQTDAELSDARTFSTSKKYDAIITSPPYPNRHDYTRIYALEMIFNFVDNNAELKKVRYDTLRSHVEAKKQLFKVTGYTQPKIINSLIARIKKAGTNNSQVTGMIQGYFEDMFLVLQRMKMSLKKRGKIALVVSNVRFSGVNVPVDTILAEIGQQAGLKIKGVLTARFRGNSAQQMGAFKRKVSRESIVVWEK